MAHDPLGSDVLDRLAESLISGHLTPDDLRDEGTPETIGRYVVLGPLGRGAFGRVYRAHDPELGRVVAIKVLSRAHATDVERFRREMQVLARLEHPSIVRVYDAGVSDEGPFFVMEHLDAPTLSDHALSLRDGVRVLEHVARACHAAHARGIVHRDLKPSNITVGSRPVVLDFGVACLMADPAPAHRRALAGTPEYMAPEQVDGREVGPWTDIHALGAILYELLAGRTPFEGGNVENVLTAVRLRDPEPPSRRARNVPAALERLALQSLAKLPDERPGSALELAERLRRWREGTPFWQTLRAPWVVATAALVLGMAVVVLLVVLLRPVPLPPPPFDERPPLEAPERPRRPADAPPAPRDPVDPPREPAPPPRSLPPAPDRPARAKTDATSPARDAAAPRAPEDAPARDDSRAPVGSDAPATALGGAAPPGPRHDLSLPEPDVAPQGSDTPPGAPDGRAGKSARHGGAQHGGAQDGGARDPRGRDGPPPRRDGRPPRRPGDGPPLPPDDPGADDGQGPGAGRGPGDRPPPRPGDRPPPRRRRPRPGMGPVPGAQGPGAGPGSAGPDGPGPGSRPDGPPGPDGPPPDDSMEGAPR